MSCGPAGRGIPCHAVRMPFEWLCKIISNFLFWSFQIPFSELNTFKIGKFSFLHPNYMPTLLAFLGQDHHSEG